MTISSSEPTIAIDPTATAANPRPARKRAAKKAAAPAPSPDGTAKPVPHETGPTDRSPVRKDPRNLYLPALPEGFDYTLVTATGPDGAHLTVSQGPDGVTMAFAGAGLEGTRQYAAMKEGIAGAVKAGRAIRDVATREAAVVAAREAAVALDL